MPKILFAVDENNKTKVLKINILPSEEVEVTDDDISELEIGSFRMDGDYSMGVYKGDLVWVDMTANYPEYEPDGFWEIGDNFKLITNLEDEIL